jgi:hypothetical protein
VLSLTARLLIARAVEHGALGVKGAHLDCVESGGTKRRETGLAGDEAKEVRGSPPSAALVSARRPRALDAAPGAARGPINTPRAPSTRANTAREKKQIHDDLSAHRPLHREPHNLETLTHQPKRPAFARERGEGALSFLSPSHLPRTPPPPPFEAARERVRLAPLVHPPARATAQAQRERKKGRTKPLPPLSRAVVVVASPRWTRATPRRSTSARWSRRTRRPKATTRTPRATSPGASNCGRSTPTLTL